jgi:hypothetical protein
LETKQADTIRFQTVFLQGYSHRMYACSFHRDCL